MLARLLVTASLLVLVVALGGNTQYFDSDFYTDGEVLSEQYSGYDFVVTGVVDGDTIKLDSGETVRYIGVDTPETKDPRKEIECFGKEASDFNRELVLGHTVRLEKDVSETDRYKRLLRYVYVVRNGKEIMVNKFLAEQGYAVADTQPPDVKYSDEFREAEEAAMFSNLGLWSECN